MLIFPDDVFYAYWSGIITVILMYTATVTPYKICFMDEEPLGFKITDWVIDVLFFSDVIITCLLAYYDDDNILVTNKK